MHGEVRASRSAKRLADDYRGELVEAVKTYPWQSVLTTKVVPRRVLPGPAPVPALPGNSAPGGAIEDAGPVQDEAGSDPPSSEEQGSQRNAAGIGSSSSNSTELRPSLEDVAVEADDTAMPEAVNPGASGRDERPVLEQSPRTPKAPRKELHPPFFAGQVKAEEAFPREDEILEWFDEEDDFSDMLTGIDEDEFYSEAAGPPDLSQEDLQIVERDSMQEEVHRLQEMKALEKVCFDTTGGNPGNVRDVPGTEADYKWLTTKFVFDWRWREVSGIKQWVRRARLVAREYRTTDGRTDCFSPATSSSIRKILPVMAVNAKKSLVTLDFKDAFLLVDQIELVECRFEAELSLWEFLRKMQRSLLGFCGRSSQDRGTQQRCGQTTWRVIWLA